MCPGFVARTKLQRMRANGPWAWSADKSLHSHPWGENQTQDIIWFPCRIQTDHVIIILHSEIHLFDAKTATKNTSCITFRNSFIMPKTAKCSYIIPVFGKHPPGGLPEKSSQGVHQQAVSYGPLVEPWGPSPVGLVVAIQNRHRRQGLSNPHTIRAPGTKKKNWVEFLRSRIYS